ncbi:unnamed protein product [Allacma fusca]|uniref:CRAL-TRIO domain-containing protein n=1 Tax=Allacma fusca TaxID=39272 RepID=A0A8J2PT98_9HEXA|nr:unnamed protein product [Allacma fusca]
MVSKYVFLVVITVFLQQAHVSFCQTEEEKDILEWEAPAEFPKMFPYYLSGYDMEGSPVWLMDFGAWDIRDIVDKGGESLSDLRKYMYQMIVRTAFEKSQNQDDGRNHKLGTPIVIIDLNGYTVAKATHVKGVVVAMDMLRIIEKFAQRGLIGSGYVVNANSIFESFWRLGKPLLGRISELIEIHGTNADKWKPVLLHKIPADQLPFRLGGSKDHQMLKTFG